MVIAAALLLLMLFLREPGHFLNPQFWAEDGSIFFLQSWEEGFTQTLLRPVAGYLHTLPRLVAGLALLFPLSATPLIFNLAAFTIQSLAVCYLLSRRLERYLPSPGLRVLAAALYVAVPNSYETYVNLTNSQWHLAFVALLVLLADRPGNRWARAGELALLALFSVTGPFGIVLLPCAVLNYRERRSDAASRWWLAQAALLAAGAAVQAATVLTTQRTGTGLGPDTAVTLRQFAQILSTHVVYNSLLGINPMLEMRWTAFLATNIVTQLLGLALTALLIAFVIRQRHRALLFLLYLAAATIALSFLFPLNDLREWLDPGFAPRYYLFATLFLLYAILLLCARGGRLRWLGVPLALLPAAVGIPGDYLEYGRRPNSQWVDQISVFEYLPRGARLYVPFQPDSWGITIPKKTPGRAGSPLDGMRRTAEITAYAFDRPRFSQSDSPQLLTFSGWVADSVDSERVARVWVAVDGQWYPAVVDRVQVRRAGDRGPQGGPFTGFERGIPLSDLHMGRHRVSLVVLRHDGTAYSPSPEKHFILFTDGSSLTVSAVM